MHTCSHSPTLNDDAIAMGLGLFRRSDTGCTSGLTVNRSVHSTKNFQHNDYDWLHCW